MIYAQLNDSDELVNGEPVAIHYNSRSFTYTIDNVVYTAPRNWMTVWDDEKKQSAHMWAMNTVYDDGINPPSASYETDKFRLTHQYSYTFDGSIVTQTASIEQYSSGTLPPLDQEASKEAFDIVTQGQLVWQQDRDRREVGATSVIDDDDKPAFDQWMRDSFDAQDAGTIPPEPPASVRRVVDMPGQQEGQCVISWFEFGGGWPGWGFKAIFKRQDITVLGLNIYDENESYLYSLTFQAGDYDDEWVTESPAGRATPTKVPRSFEIIAGSAPVTEFLTLDDTKEHISLMVKWTA